MSVSSRTLLCQGIACTPQGETSSTPEYCEEVTLLSLDLEAMSCSCKLQRFLQYFSTSGICEELLAHESSSLFVVRSSTNAVINK